MHLTTTIVLLGASAVFAKKPDKPAPPSAPPRRIAPVKINIHLRDSCTDTACTTWLAPNEYKPFKDTKGMLIMSGRNDDVSDESGEFLFSSYSEWDTNGVVNSASVPGR
jgi:hypothetical protein